MSRFRLLFVVPTLLLLVAMIAPLVVGSETLVYRDVLGTHYPLKAAQGQLLDDGTLLPLVDPSRAGEPLLGNLNALVLYPTSVLLAVADPLWVLNAHFWLHWLLAPFAGYWLGRAWGLGRPGAWAVGVVYASSGYFLSTMNLFNVVAGAALTPAFIAASLGAGRPRTGRPESGRRWAIVAVLGALLILAGDPVLALTAFGLGALAIVLRRRGEDRGRGGLLPSGLGFAAALAGSALLAAPQIVETLRILPRSSRGYWRYSTETILEMSWAPLLALEQWTPLLFGAPPDAPWTPSLFGGHEPLLPSLHLGFAALALVAAGAGGGGRAATWAWLSLGLGLFLALGRFNPLLVTLVDLGGETLPGATLLRYPMRLWSVVTLAVAVLAGLGLERLSAGAGRARLRLVAAVGAGLFAAALVGLVVPGAPAARFLARLADEPFTAPELGAEAFRWSLLWLAQLVLCLVLLGASFTWRRSASATAALVLAVHCASQIVMLRPLLLTDEASGYREPPALASAGARFPDMGLPDDALLETGLLFHAGANRSFGPVRHVAPTGGDDPALSTRAYMATAPASSGIPAGLRYGLSTSPEGLDSLYTRSTLDALELLDDDGAKLRLLRASGVDALIAPRPVRDPQAVGGGPIGEPPMPPMWIYRLHDTPPDYFVAETVHTAPDMRRGLDAMTAPTFDPARDVLLPAAAPVGAGAQAAHRHGARGTVRVLDDAPERVILEVQIEDVASPGGVVVASERSWLPLWRAAVDGEEAEVLVANMHRMAVAVPAGSHRVELSIDRRPTAAAVSASILGWLGVAALGLVGRRRPSHS